MESLARGVEVAKPILPLLNIEKAEIVDVAVPVTVEVARKKFPPVFRNVHWPIPATSERAS